MRQENDAPFTFRCRRSGNCCARPDGGVRVSPADVTRLASHLGLSEQAFRSRFVSARGTHLIDGPGARCVFLEDGRTARCSVYAARPERCRMWPFWEEHRDPAALAEAARICPGIALTTAAGDGQRP